MQIVSYLPSALSAETNIILFDSIRPRSRTDVLSTPCPRAIPICFVIIFNIAKSIQFFLIYMVEKARTS